MVQRHQLLSPTLIFPSQDTLVSTGSKQTPVFGQPFRFGKPLVFARASAPDGSHGTHGSPLLQQQQESCIAAAPRAGRTLLQSSSTRKQPNALQTPTKDGQPAHATASHAGNTGKLDEKQQRQAAPPSASSAAACSSDSLAESAITASKYYLGSLGAALAHGWASPAAAAAAITATANTAAQLASAAAQTSCKPTGTPVSTCINASTADRANAAHAVQLGPAAAAAASAAAAACSGCPGCRMMVQRLQSCSQCTKSKQPSSAICGNENSAADGDDQGKGRVKRKACEVDDTPGPGQYNVASTIGQGVAFSIGSRAPATQATTAAEEHPGPGAYYNPAGSSAAGGPAFTIAGRWKEPGQDATAPGPGERQRTAYIVDGPAFTMSSKQSCKNKRSNSPGPGAYAPDWDRSRSPDGPAYSIAGRLVDPSVRSTSPGPAQYQKIDFKANGPAYTFPAKPQQRARSASDSPAPGDYNTAHSEAASSKISSAPAYTFAGREASGIDQMFKEVFPGPGTYDVLSVGPSGPAFSMPSRPEAKKASQQAVQEPGPGDYYIDTVPGSSGPAFSLAARPSSPQTGSGNLVGPGTYYNPAAEAAAHGGQAFTIGARLEQEKQKAGQDSPGPGSYKILEEPTGPAITMGSRPEPRDMASVSPGPGIYEIKPMLPEAPAFTMGRKPRDKTATDGGGPAVGEYEVVDSAGMAVGGPAWTLGARRIPTEQNTSAAMPGPGEYHSSTPDISGPAWTIAGKLADPASERAADGPGPGEHHKGDWSSLAGPAFTLAGKAAVLDREADSPGPGAYLTPDYADPAAADAPAFTIGIRPTAQQPDSTLGPGAFNLPELARGPAFTVGTRTAATEQCSVVPGPASYDIAAAADAVEVASPAWTLGRRLKDKSAGAASPAPGDYDPANSSAAAAPAWTIGTKADAVATAAILQPGPGQYTPMDPVKDDRGQAFTIGQRHKDKAVGGGDMPAPGEYNVLSGGSGPAFTLAGRISAATDTVVTPAPGQYHHTQQPGAETPAYTIASRTASSVGAAASAALTTTGPGAYDITAAHAATASAAPAYTITGKGMTCGAAVTDGPGAGKYDVRELGPAGPSYSMGQRLATDKIAEGPAPVDYYPDDATTSGMLSAPAFTIASKAPERTMPEDPTPAPGTYHGPATAGPPPHAPIAPSFSYQGNQKKGKSRLSHLLGKLADIDAKVLVSGQHQPPEGGSTASHGTVSTLGPSVAGAAGDASAAAAAAQKLTQMQEQLAKLLVKQTQRATKKASRITPAAGLQGPARQPTDAVTDSQVQQQLQQQQESGSNLGQLGQHSRVADLTAISAAVHDALLLSKGRGARPSSSRKTRELKDYASPGPGDCHVTTSAATGSFGTVGPSYTMGAKGAAGEHQVASTESKAQRPILKKTSSTGGSKRVSFSGGND